MGTRHTRIVSLSARILPQVKEWAFLLSKRIVPLALAMLAVGCRPELPKSGGATVDDAGRAIALDGPATRIVSLSPSITELLFAIGAGDRVVGRTRWDQDPPEALVVPSVGDGLAPNIEAILARSPDLVVFYLSPANAQAIDRLGGFGIATASFALDRLGDLERVARALGSLTGNSATADSLVQFLDRRLSDESVETPDPPNVLILAWDDPPIVIGGASFLSEIVERSGGRNAFGDSDRPSLTVSIETIVERDPDVVLVTGSESAAFADRPEWQAVRAIRNRRFAVVQGTEFAQPSFRAPSAIRQLSRILAGTTP